MYTTDDIHQPLTIVAVTCPGSFTISDHSNIVRAIVQPNNGSNNVNFN